LGARGNCGLAMTLIEARLRKAGGAAERSHGLIRRFASILPDGPARMPTSIIPIAQTKARARA